MKQIQIITFFLSLLPVCFYCQNIKKTNLALLSNQIPTDTPLIFGQGIISTDNNKEFAITFNPEMNELFFTRRKPKGTNEIYTSKLIDLKWSKPELASFSTDNGWDYQPHINPKGDKLYFGSTRQINDTINSSGVNEWYCVKENKRWSNPKPLESPFSERFVMYLTSTYDDNLYFSSKEKGAKHEDGGIYYSINEKGHYKNVQKMGKEINFSGKWIAHSYIAPDESYIIYDAERTSINENGDLYISFNHNGNWTNSCSLGPKINTEQNETGASVSPDGKYLFFSRSFEKTTEDGSTYWTGNIYWIDFTQLKKKLLQKINSN
ncbi:PD40 domain-containing protein [Aquimarina pacifica]|uniref:PD40 domain-containing protein n=1 Tax=Aquimarina pacifica TaxID=1296415 RepID=UPI00047271F5|nr:PD40 domain-containing protein [Aquimarina pacifica]